jgi:quinol monooxygenase YgiN
MIVVHVEYRYAPAAEDAMRSLVPDVERFSRGFDGCQSFALSFPVGRSGILLGTEVWADAASLRAHVAVVHDAAELEPWHRLLRGMDASLFAGERVSLEELEAEDVGR